MLKSKIRAKITEITYLAMLCEEIGFYCFVSFQAHVNQFSVKLHSVKKSYVKGEISTRFYLSDERYALEQCNSILYQLKSLLKKNKVDYSKLYEQERIEIDYVF